MSKTFLSISVLLLISTVVTAVMSEFAKTRRTISLSIQNKDNLVVEDGAVLDGVRRHDTIDWVIKGAEIKNFSIASKTKRHIFTTDIPTDPRPSLKLVVKWLTHLTGKDWDYSITWFDSNGVPHPVDPKVPVKPIVRLTPFLILLSLLTSLLSALFYRRDLQRQKTKLVIS